MSSPRIEAAGHADFRYYRRFFNYAFIWNLAHAPRRRMFDCFMAELAPTKGDTALDLGCSNLPEPLENIFEEYYPFKDRITAAGMEDCRFLEDRCPGLRFVRVESGKPLPFKDNEFDVGFSSATIEHAGSRAQQGLFLSEILRVSSRVFLTTPNRYFPFELHTRLPLLHWLPPRVFRAILRVIGLKFYAEEANLNLLSAGDLRSLIPPGKYRRVELRYNYFMGFASNLMLIIEKGGGA